MTEESLDSQLTTLFQTRLSLTNERMDALFERIDLEIEDESANLGWDTFLKVMTNLRVFWTPAQQWASRPPLYAISSMS